MIEDDDKIYLSDSEYYTLEAFSWKAQELDYKKKIKLLQKTIEGKDIALLRHSLADAERKAKKLLDEAQSLEVAKENVLKQKDKFSVTITESRNLEDNDWGYNPETLEILTT